MLDEGREGDVEAAEEDDVDADDDVDGWDVVDDLDSHRGVTEDVRRPLRGRGRRLRSV